MIGWAVRRGVAVVGLVGAATVSLDLATIIVAVGALGTAVYNVFRIRQTQPTIEADLEDRAVSRLRAALDEYTQDNTRLRAEVRSLESTEVELRVEVRQLRQRIEYLVGVLERAGLNGA